MKRNKAIIAIAIFLLVIIIDQIIKLEVKTSMFLGQKIYITDWFQLYFVENDGFAFGWKLGGKVFLTIFRIVAVSAICWFICREIKNNAKMGYIICLSLIAAGAAGNIFDCLFYGLIFNDPLPPLVAQYVGWAHGYSDFLTGKVVDMFYFPLIEWDMPTWMPIYGGEHCIFFSPIFNFADAAISCGVVALLLFYYKTVNVSLHK
ncbi:MAG: lipoprotein signal peptidase [Prevotellaceae bacterium]|nr:lipoprotein signal peptidase [Candidatus Colivivens equi]MCQ2076553.1 lipoprotein signal peptidase [Bacteroidaceae bacterium]